MTTPAQPKKLYTAADMLNLPDDDYRYELERGVIIREPPPGYAHGQTTVTLASYLFAFVRQHDLGSVVTETGTWLERDPDTVRGPDLAFISTARIPPPGERDGYLPVAPDLPVEILSPSERRGKITAKIQEYFRGGSRLVWVVDPRRRTVAVHRPDGSTQLLFEEDTLSGEDVLPGFTLRVGEIFA